jgi:SecD/SecF fusion protein
MRGTDLDFSGTGSGYDDRARTYFVQFGLKHDGVRRFRELTRTEAERGRARGAIQHAAFVLDGEIKAFPGLDYREDPDGITSPSGASIADLRTLTEADNLALVLQTGALPIGFRQIQRTEISATLGRDSLDQAIRAAAVALVLIAAFLLVLYRLLGLVAIVGLCVYAAFLYGIVLLLGVTVTLPGFAGLILAVAVAADANVVIFERIKEEVRAGHGVADAIDRGYRKGFHTIVDANVVTGITALVLFLVATALVKGFALLLLIGTMISLVTAVATTRALLGLLTDVPGLATPVLIGVGSRQGSRRLDLDFVGRRRTWFAISGSIIAAGAISLAVRGLDFGIDFRSGSQFTFATAAPHSTSDVRAVAAQVGRADAEIIGSGAHSGDGYRAFEVRTRFLGPAQTRAFQRDLRERIGARAFGVESVSASFGNEIARAAVWALLVSLALIVLYIGWRFDFGYALPVLVALCHDVFITIGIYSLSGHEVTAASVAAVLTVLGYSIYDTLIIFDRIRENLARTRLSSYADVVNLSLSQTIRRSLATTFITLLPIAALLFFGGPTLTGFAFALLVGVISGAYSSIFIAAPLLSVLRERRWTPPEPVAEQAPESVLAALRALADRQAIAEEPGSPQP